MTRFILIATASIICSHDSFAQLNFNKALKGISSQVQHQVKQEFQRQIPQVTQSVVHYVSKPSCNKPQPRPLPHPVPQPYPQPKPCPRPVPQPKPQPVPHPVPAAQPSPVVSPQPGSRPQPVVELPQIEAGQRVTIDGKLFGPNPGRVAVKIGALMLDAEVTAWTSTQATAILPELPMADSARATVMVFTAAGYVADQLEIELMPATSVTHDSGDQTPVDSELPVVASGQEIRLDSSRMGMEHGKVQVNVSGLVLNAKVTSWSGSHTTAIMPSLRITNPVRATVLIVTAQGQIVEQVAVMFSPELPVAVR